MEPTQTSRIGRQVSESILRRLDLPIPLLHEPISSFKGKLFGVLTTPQGLPEGHQLRGVILAGGSEGGVPLGLAEYLARRGMAVLSVAYLWADPPQGLFHRGSAADAKWNEVSEHATMIDIAWFKEAAALLRQRHNDESAKIAGLGISYGSQVMLALASNYPNMFSSIALWTPNMLIRRGTTQNGRPEPPPARLAAFMNETQFSIDNNPYPDGGYRVNPRWEDPYRARIALENIAVPVFAVSGGMDNVWFRQRGEAHLFPDYLNAEQIGKLISPEQDSAVNFFKHYPSNGHCFLPDEVVRAECGGHEDLVKAWYNTALEKSGGQSTHTIQTCSQESFGEFWKFLRKTLDFNTLGT